MEGTSHTGGHDVVIPVFPRRRDSGAMSEGFKSTSQIYYGFGAQLITIVHAHAFLIH
jgi:hypothetical protein